MKPQVLIVAAEASSALFAQRLLEHWKSINFQVQAFGVGTPEMEALGFERLGKSEEMAVVGVAEVIENYSHLKSVFHSLVAAAKARQPRVVVVLDYPEFNLRLAKEMKALGLPVIYYVSPQVWAWRKGRVKQIRAYCEKVLLLFPFEIDFYKKEKVAFEFVGHPALDEIRPELYSSQYQNLQRSRRGIMPGELVVGLMPGSRRSEIKNHLQTQVEVVKALSHKFPKLKFIFLVAPTVELTDFQEKVHQLMKNSGISYLLIKDEPLEMIALTDFILAASGTATLMVGLLEKPMVIMYKMKWFTGIMAKLLVHGVKFFGIVNLIMDKEIVPERWQGGANVAELTRLLARFIEDSQYLQKVRDDLGQLKFRLGDRGATGRVAKALEPYLKDQAI